MTQVPQKNRERRHLDLFLGLLDGGDGFQVKEGAEPPDFYLYSSDEHRNPLAVEITELYQSAEDGGGSLQAQEQLRSSIVCRAEQEYSAAGLPNVQVSVMFNPSNGLRKSDGIRLSGRLVELVRRNLPKAGLAPCEESYNWRNRDYFPEEFSSVSVARIADLGSSWRVPGGTWVPTRGVEEFQLVVGRKAKGLAGYRDKCSSAWLLLVADGFSLGTMFDVGPEVYAGLDRQGFDRVFLLKDQRQLRELGMVE